MKKYGIVIVNIVIVLGILLFVVQYSRFERISMIQQQTEAFGSMTVAMEKVTTNYLEGEQRICDTWARYLNNRPMNIEQAIAFLRVVQVRTVNAAHVIFTDDNSLTGLSTRAKVTNPDDYKVSYGSIGVFRQSMLSPEADAERSVNITRAYTNPMNGVQSIAFYSRVTLADADTGAPREALLLRVVPISVFEQEWTFPTEEYASAEISMIDAAGNYIIKGKSFKNSSFFEFYKSYNETNFTEMEALERKIISETGTLNMLNSKGQPCLVAHTPIASTGDWAIVTSIPRANLSLPTVDWFMIGVVSAGLLLLFVLDLIFMLRFNHKLKETAAEAASANRAKTDFLSTMSHDIRTPMNAIIGLTTIAGKNVNDPDAVKESLKKINLASSHLLTLINDILDISKVESGKLNLSPVTFSLVETAENLVNLSQPMVKEKNIVFNFRINRIDHEYLRADQLRLNQIFINLLSNAVKYTEPGGSVSVDMLESPGSTDGTVTLTYIVADTGIGMTPEFMKKMYQPFSRQTDSRVNTVQGTGLGLAITRQMIDLMGGTIECESAVGKGTTFTVKLEIPIADRSVENMSLSPVRVLIADDDPVLLETAEETLASIGATPETAASGCEAVSMVADRRSRGEGYGVVILDWRMPDMDGIEAARRIRAEADADVPILLISAYDWSDIEDAARTAGANGFISKPLFKSTLYDKLSELLGVEPADRHEEDDTSDLAGMHVLVAEDNDVNWEIISMLLEMHGINCERAANGKAAVERMQTAKPGDFDLIFMDIQMPVMNGLDATKAIRALEDPWASAVPIIAMTADAFSENVAECMAAGMNGHIAKPIDMKLVLKELRRIREGAA